MKKIILNLFLCSITAILSGDFITAQTFNLQNVPGENSQISMKFNKPFYSEEFLNMSAFSGAFELSVNFPVTKKLNLIAALPYITTSYEEEDSLNGTLNYEKNGIGNFFIGMQTRPDTPEEDMSIITFGLFLPTADKEAAYEGAYADYYYLQKYLPNTFGVYFNYAYHKTPKKGFHYGAEIGPNIVLPSKKGIDTDLFFHYGINGGYKTNNFSINAELVGIYIATGEASEFSDRFVHMIDFGIQLSGDVIQPKIFYGIYLKDGLNDYVNGVLGIGLTLSFK